MKTCPVCRKTYNDDSLAFCLDDGTPLINSQNEPETVVSRNLNQPSRESFGEPARPTKSNTGLLVGITVCAVLLLSLVGIAAAYFIFKPTEDAKTNQKSNSSVNSNRNSSSNANKSEVGDLQNSPVERMNSNRPSIPVPNQNTSKQSNQNAPAQIVASASSVRKPMQGNVYFPNFAFDGNPATAWCEGGTGAGVGEWLRFDFDREVNLKQIKIQPGYFKSEESWRKNNRVQSVSVQCSNGAALDGNQLADEMTTQTINVNCAKTRWVKISIDDYYPGDNDSQDTLVSEVSFVTEP